MQPQPTPIAAERSSERSKERSFCPKPLILWHDTAPQTLVACVLVAMTVSMSCRRGNAYHTNRVLQVSNDARSLHRFIAQYAREHNGVYPRSLNDLTATTFPETSVRAVQDIVARYPHLVYQPESDKALLRLPTGVEGKRWVIVAKDGEVLAVDYGPEEERTE